MASIRRGGWLRKSSTRKDGWWLKIVVPAVIPKLRQGRVSLPDLPDGVYYPAYVTGSPVDVK